jgi:hypothetical protein
MDIMSSRRPSRRGSLGGAEDTDVNLGAPLLGAGDCPGSSGWL